MGSRVESRGMGSKYRRSRSHKKRQEKEVFHGRQVVVVVVPFPAQGHLNQLLHLSRLILAQNIPVHFVGSASHNRQAIGRAQGWEAKSIYKIDIHDLSVAPFASPAPNPNEETRFPSHLVPSFEASSSLREPVYALLQSLSSVARRVVVIYDSLMASVVQDAIHLSNCESYTFHSVSAFTMFLFFWEAMGRPPVEMSHVPQVPSLEGCFTAQFIDFISSQYQFHKFSKGTIYNTTRAIERPYMELIESMIRGKSHWALGPFNPLSVEKELPCNENKRQKHLSVEWLDKQEEGSVLYVSFGTTTCLSEEQIKEVAEGLEKSKQKFIWVVREADKGDVFKEDGARMAELPKGFEERVDGRGLVVRDWAPQLDILGHPSTGGFMSHCGWNSCMESITMGVPIAAWPMHSDQPRNTVLLTHVLKIALPVKDWDHMDHFVTASHVQNAVTTLMATKLGHQMRHRASNLKIAILNSRDQGGLSRIEFDRFIAHLTR
ncbi:hypothetical protein VNO78_17079 [Psophocarpus tetragonolobus]|uniref:Glycosyltransferase n=1 Tax=Psophocarpus tetragonolobus TaxID=3891 RepID=A0AAN9XKW1_PSOTE